MNKIITDEDKEICDPKAILCEQHRFYAKLYQSDPSINFNITPSGPVIDNEMRVELDKEITFDEVTQAIRSFPPNKCQGPDGVIAELLQFFWNKLGKLYYRALLHAKRNKKLHLAARRGVISLIPKKSKDPLRIRNWHPLTMLTLDYKILAKVIANRMKLVLKDVISPSQFGYMEGRQISTSIRIAIDIACYNKKVKGYMLVLDFQKCFDMIEYSAIKNSLRNLGFGEGFLEWVNLLLEDFTSVTSNNGYFSEHIPITGCQAFLFFLFFSLNSFFPIFSYFSALIPIFPIFFRF